MKTKHFIIAVAISSCIISPILLARGGKGKGWGGGGGGGGGGSTPTLTQKEAADIIYLREEEKLARDVYLAMYDVWGAQIFLNISGSEQRHTDAVKGLIIKYDLDDPVVDDSPGVYTNPVFAEIYASLIDKGMLSLKDALEVGVDIEEMDIHDIEVEMLPDATRTDVKNVMTNLLAGSYNHLSAFNNWLASQ